MNNSLATSNSVVQVQEVDVSASGVWSKSYIQRPLANWKIARLGKIAGMVFAIAASPATAMPDYWFWEKRMRDTSRVAWVIGSVIGKPITRADALQISRMIMERAEQERFNLVERESLRGIHWENNE